MTSIIQTLTFFLFLSGIQAADNTRDVMSQSEARNVDTVEIGEKILNASEEKLHFKLLGERKMKVLILGGTNFIGPYVAASLHQKGADVSLFHRGKTQRDFPFPVNHIYGDRHDFSAHASSFKDLSPQVVIDMFPYSKKDAQELIQAFKNITSHFVILSSADVYRAHDRLWNNISGDIEETPLTENSPLREISFPHRVRAPAADHFLYDYDKIHVEQTILQEPAVNATILRLPVVYGPGDHSRLWGYVKRLDENRPILLDAQKARWKLCRGYVEDVAEAVALAALKSPPGKRIYNVGEPEALTEIDWIQRIAKAAGQKAHIVTVRGGKLPAHLKEPLFWGQSLTVDTALIRAELGYKEQALDAMKDAVDWVRAHECHDTALLASVNYAEEDKVLSS